MSSARITYSQRPDATPEAELAVLAAAYKFVLFNSLARRGGPHDLTNKTTTEHVGKQTTEQTESEKSQRDETNGSRIRAPAPQPLRAGGHAGETRE